MLTEDGVLVMKSNKIANTFNEYFGTIVEDLDLYYWRDNSEFLSNTKSFDRINNIVKIYKNHPNIKISKRNSRILVIFLSK